jgi:hypothetical protein
LQNSQCTVNTAQLVGPLTGNLFTVTLTVIFQPAFSAVTNFYAESNSITRTSSGWQLLGTWGPYIPVPGSFSAVPANGGGHTQTFTFSASYVEGAAQISSLWMMFGTPVRGTNLYGINVPNVCLIIYYPQYNSLTLMDDAGISGSAGTPGSPALLANSQCKVDAAHSSVTVSGNNIVVQVPVTFSYDFAGNQPIWMNAVAVDSGGPFSQMGAWTVPPSPVSFAVSPSSSTFGQPVTLTASLNAGGGTGTMTFVDGSNVLGTGVMVSGTAVFQSILLTPGNHKLIAYYSGDSSHAAGQSPTVSESISAVAWTQLTAVAPASAGSNPISMAVGDFNRDNRADLVVANQSGGVSVLLGNGDGTFQTPVPYSTGGSPTSVAIGDFNRDGVADLAVGVSTGVSVLLGNADWTFQSAINYPAGSGGVSSLAVADFNGDGIADIVAGSLGTSAILPGNGDGSFRSPIAVTVPGAISVAPIYDNRGSVDLVVLLGAGGGADFLPGNGDFTFQAATTMPTLGNSPTAIAVADVFGSGSQGLVVGTQAAVQNLLVLPTSSGGGAPLLQDFATIPVQTSAVAVSDFNGDGKPDLAAMGSNGTSGALEILLGNSSFTFQPPVNFPVGAAQTAMAIGDFDGDGRPDLALLNYTGGTVSILLGASPSGATSMLSIAKTHSGSLLLGQSAATYHVTVSNGGPATNGPITVTENLPQDLSLESMSGGGWSCGTPANQCSRQDPLGQWGSYQPITVKVGVSSTAVSPVVNSVSVTGGGSPSMTAFDPATTVTPTPCDFTIVGSTTILDLQEIVNEALGLAAPVHDLDRNGTVSIADVQTVLNAALGGTCFVP